MAENRELALVLKLVADQFKTELRSSQGALSGFNDFIKDWKTQLIAVGAALFATAKSTANFGEEALKGAQKIGLTVQVFTSLSHAARMSDLDNQQLIVGMKSLSKNMVEAQRNTVDGEAVFRRLGISAVDASGKLRSTDEVLLDLAEVFEKSADGAGKTEAAVKLLGKSGIDLIPFLNQGRAGINELREQAKRLGLVLSEDDAKAADEFNTKLKEMDATVKGLTVAVGLPLMRGLTDLMQMFQEVGASAKSSLAEMEWFSKHLSENFGKSGLGQGSMDLFTALGFGHRKGEAPGSAELALTGALGIKPGGPDGGSGGGREVKATINKPPLPSVGSPADQEKLGKAKLEIFLAQNRALEIQAKLAREAAAGPNEMFLAFDRQEQFRKEDEAEQVRQGQAIVQRTQFEVQLRDRAAASERESLIKNAQAWIDYDNQVGASTQARYDHQMDLLRANLSKETQLTEEESGRLLIAWQNHDTQLKTDILNRTQLFGQDRETLERQYLTKLVALNQQYSGDAFAGWKKGLEDYVRNTDSAFGFAAQMAQRTAQFMEQNFRTFFFDLMDNKIKSLKDLFSSFANFAKQIIAQVLAQLATMAVLNAVTGGGGGIFGGLGGLFGGIGGRNVSGINVRAMKFASGGTVLGSGNQDTVRAMLTPGEGVLNRRGMATLDRLNSGDDLSARAAGETNITVNIVNSGRTDQPQVTFRQGVKSMMLDLIYRDQDVRGLLREGMA